VPINPFSGIIIKDPAAGAKLNESAIINLAIVLGLSLAHLIQASLNLLLHRGKKKSY